MLSRRHVLRSLCTVPFAPIVTFQPSEAAAPAERNPDDFEMPTVSAQELADLESRACKEAHPETWQDVTYADCGPVDELVTAAYLVTKDRQAINNWCLRMERVHVINKVRWWQLGKADDPFNRGYGHVTLFYVLTEEFKPFEEFFRSPFCYA
ncbi:hypothetical protein [Aureliella helgolandensis]|uniref:Uncharacterized protein n=1 Tax=Aureliella helgolandensis TaxID=2527968 RepID=A0A518G349_9BACT|nr:hypothetical protein [Aureliella helgolandensis]QDV23028.1 hypothetical protein Q31a_13210 [Aureliella helgolandensis]